MGGYHVWKTQLQRESLTSPSFPPSLCECYLELFLGSQRLWSAAPPPGWSTLETGGFFLGAQGDLLLPGGLAWIRVPYSFLPFSAIGLLPSWFEMCPPFISIQAKVEKKTEASAPARKPEPNAVAKTSGPIVSAQKPPAGKVSFI